VRLPHRGCPVGPLGGASCRAGCGGPGVHAGERVGRDDIVVGVSPGGPLRSQPGGGHPGRRRFGGRALEEFLSPSFSESE